LVSNFLGGWIAARWSLGRVMSVAMLVLGLALVGLPFLVPSPAWVLYTTTSVDADGATHAVPTLFYPQLALYVLAMGGAGGIVTVLFFTIWGHAYGRRHLGKIQGVAQMLTVLASAVGPLLLARTKEATGSYAGMFWSMAGVAAFFCVAAWLIPVPCASLIKDESEKHS
jgi:MFS family permease